MNMFQLAWRNISRNAFRSWVVGLCALLVAAFALFTTIVMRGAETSLQLTSDRLGADIIVVPEGTASKMEGALVMGVPVKFWMPRANVEKLAAIDDVQMASPQVYLETLTGASCCSVPSMFMVAYDPATDFTVRPWLVEKLGGDGLKQGEVVGGSYVSATEDNQVIRVYGYPAKLKTNLQPTGTGLDQSMFFTIDTAQQIAKASITQAEIPLSVPTDQVSAVLIKLKPNTDARSAAVKIYQQVSNVTPIISSDLFQLSRKQLDSLLKTVVSMMGLTWALSVMMIGLVFSMAANERRRELGVLRAFGANRAFICKSLLVEAGLLSICGGGIGIGLAVMASFLFRQFIIITLGIPYLLPSIDMLLFQVVGGLVLTLLSVCLAALFPALKISCQDPAIAMRE
ncbi:MAG: FtsX-like permease family protein [Chloroflexi bacterium]|nr:FtsX-like permease family protein [Chloroflexota bacterium]